METTARSYRFQASTKAEQIMWSKAFTVLFELRARVSANLKTTIDINEYLGIRPGQTLTINYDSDHEIKYIKKDKKSARQPQEKSKRSSREQPQMRNREQVNRKLEDYKKRIEREKMSMLQGTDEFEDSLSDIDINNDKIDLPKKKYQNKKKEETMGATSRNSHSPDLDDLGKDNIELESIDGSTSRCDNRSSRFNNYDTNNSRMSHQTNKKVFKEAQLDQQRAKSMQMKTQILMKQHALLQQKIEANKKLMNETMMLNNFKKQKFVPLKVEDFEVEEEEKKEEEKTEDQEEEYDEEEYYDEEYDEEADQAAQRKTPKKGTPKKGSNLKILTPNGSENRRHSPKKGGSPARNRVSPLK